MAITVSAIYRYPVKGLSPAPLSEAVLEPGKGLAFDRAYALARGGAAFDPAAPEWLPKTNFLMLMRDEALAALQTSFDPESGTLTIRDGGRIAIEAPLGEANGRAAIEAFFADYLGDTGAGGPRLVSAPDHMFSDNPEKVVSLINIASIEALSDEIEAAIDPLRFRANVYFNGAPAWSEFDWLGEKIRVGGAVLEARKRIQRCAATNVDPATGVRDMNIPKALHAAYAHADLGIYGRVVTGGKITPGDQIVVLTE